MGANVSSASDESLHIAIGQVDDTPNGDGQRAANRVKTSKYTWWSFIPINFYEQFRRAVYFYFLIVTIVSFFVNSTLSPMTSLIPLLFVLVMTALKEGIEDYYRHKNDNIVNSVKVTVIRNEQEKCIASEQIAPGDLVLIRDDEEVPCDIVLLESSDVQGRCYVTTANLDGETNIKTQWVPRGLVAGQVMQGEIICEPSHTDLYTFHGRIEQQSGAETIMVPLTVDNLLLRGARVKKTKRIIGCAIYTGMSTKLQLNSKYTSTKSATSEHSINKFVISIIIAMFLLVFMCFMLERLDNTRNFEYLGQRKTTSTAMAMLDDILSMLILFNYIVPISMYINIEVYRGYGRIFMTNDPQLYDEETDEPCIVHASNLNEDLGQINIIFSDKTGTLTKNEMNFLKCSIAGKKYDCQTAQLISIDSKEAYSIDNFDPKQKSFFDALAICHTAQVSDEIEQLLNSHNVKEPNCLLKEQNIIGLYQASSPDEKALIEGCARLGLVYIGDTADDVMRLRHVPYAAYHGIETVTETRYKRLHVLEFDSDRKRMSVIVQDAYDEIWLYSKGAENNISSLCAPQNEELIIQTDGHIMDFAKAGLRTLAIARRKLNASEYQRFAACYNKAMSALERRKELLTLCYAQVEHDLELLGATAVEDVLQDNVAETLEALQTAGIKIWVLTGDKVETALNIGLSCRHIPAEAQIHFLVDQPHKDELLRQLRVIEQSRAGTSTSPQREHALIVDGKSLTIALDEAPLQFREMALQFKAVLCCRLSPLQKGKVVKLIKSPTKRQSQQYITAAIGDGANDVSMLQEAHIGIGIVGREGRQASRAADYSIAKFRMLQRLLLVHGHYNAARLSYLVNFYCYKNILLSGCMLFFQFYDLFSASSIFVALYLWLFDIVYISVSFTFVALSDKPYSEETLMSQPELYKKHADNKQLSWSAFGMWMLNALVHMVIIYFFAFATISNNVVFAKGQTADFYCFGTMMIWIIVLVGNLKLFLLTTYITHISLIFNIASILLFMLSTFINNLLTSSELYGVYDMFVGSLTMWLFSLVTTVTCLLPDFLVKVLQNSDLGTRFKQVKVFGNSFRSLSA